MWSTYIQASNTDDVIKHLATFGSKARVIAGGTDLMLEMERGARAGVEVLIDVSRIPGLAEIMLDDRDWIHIGPTVTHNHCVESELIRQRAYPLARACWEVGSPQIRNRGTVAGNIITASPANDTITPLMALGAVVTLRSLSGDRRIPLAEFYTGVRRNVMRDDELLVDIAFPALREDQVGTFVKFALRKAQAISLVNLSVILSLIDGVIGEAIITLGAVAPTIIHAVAAEKSLVGKALTEESISAAAVLTMEATRPINDLRGSAKYRRTMARVIAQRALRSLREGREREDFPEMPVKLWGGDRTKEHPCRRRGDLARKRPANRDDDQWKSLLAQGVPFKIFAAHAPRRCGPDRNERRLRRGRMWGLYSRPGWKSGDELHGSRGKSSSGRKYKQSRGWPGRMSCTRFRGLL